MYDTIVIGGGIAGLYVAMQLDKALVLEADSRLGGRIFTHPTLKYEVGAGRIDTRHMLVRALLKQFHLTERKLPSSPTDDALLHMLPLQESDRFRDRTLGDICRARVGKATTEHLRRAFGYYSEFEVMNAHDAVALLREALSGSYVVVEEGLSELVKRMSRHIAYELNHKVQRVERTSTGFLVDGRACKRVVFAVPPKALAKFHVISGPDLHAVAPVALLRVYAVYATGWAKGLQSRTTDAWIRHIIFITPKIVMVAYVEGRDTEPFRTQRGLKSNSVLSKSIHRELRALYPDITIPDPIRFQPYLWEEGGHAWLPGVHSEAVARRVLAPSDGIFVCGEAYSHKQAWVEGALETAVEVLKKIDASSHG